MSDFNNNANGIGFSTGALEKGDYRHAVEWLRKNKVESVELSALRFDELKPLVWDIETLPICSFNYISFHAPSAFPEESELEVVELLKRVSKRGWNIIVHPDVIKKPKLWLSFGKQLLLENMDRRKPVARTAHELETWFQALPEAQLCLDVAHARQLDTTLNLLAEIVSRFASKIAEIHISELDSNCNHRLMSAASVMDYQQLAGRFRPSTPVIIESMLDESDTKTRLHELESARLAMDVRSSKHASASSRASFFYSWSTKTAKKTPKRTAHRLAFAK